MFLGQYEHTIDEKGRMTIPARFRGLLAEGAYITQGFDENLIVLTAPIFDRVYQRINQLSMTDPDARLLKRLLFANAVQVDVDKAGRILIPQFLRMSTLLESGAYVVGVGDYFEIWAPTTWITQSNLMQNPGANAQRFAALDLTI
jgi:MraZ protein